MTRKKSNVKALALAVTCAILAGGYSGLNPVYASPSGGNVVYSSDNKGLQYETTTTAGSIDITELTVGGVTIGDSGKISGTSITLSGASTFNGASKFSAATEFSGTATFGGQSTFNAGILANKISEATTGSGVTVGGVTFKNNNINTSGTITVSKLALSGGTHNLEDVGGAIDTNKANIAANTTKIDTKADKTDLNTASGKITALEGKTTNLDDDGTTLTNMTKVSATTLEVDGKEITAEKVDKYDAAVSKTAKITQNTDGSTTVNDVTFKAGAVSGVTSINGKIEISNDGKTVTFNKDVEKGQVVISEDGIKVGTGSAYINNDGFKAGADGKNSLTTNGLTATTIKAGTNNTEFTVDADGNVVSKGSVTANQAGFNNLAVTNGLTVGSTTGNFVNMLDGNVTATGDIQGKNITATGNLSVAGTSTFTGETTFSGGIKTDKIDEATSNAGVTVDGVVLKDGGISAAGGKFTVDADGAVKAAGGKFGVDKDGNTNVGGTLDVTGDTTLKGKLDVKGDISTDGNVTAKGGLSAANGKFTVNETSGLVTFGNNAGNQSTIAGKTATFGLDTGDQTVINGGAITAKSLTVDSFGAATITANDTLKVGTDVSLDKNGNLDLGTNTLTDAQLGNINNTIKAGQVIDAKSGEIGGVKFSTTGEISDVKNITAEKGTIGQVGLEGGKITANNGGTIAGVNFATGGNVSGINELTATTIKDGAGTIINGGNVKSTTANIGAISIDNEKIEGSSANGLTIENVKIKDGVVSDVTSLTADKATIGGVNKLDNTGIKVDTGSTIQVGAKTVIEDGSIAVSTNTKLTDQELTLNTTNTWTAAGGLKADKATVNGVVLGADATQGKATFTDAAGKVTTIAGDTITTGTITAGELLVDSISLGKDPGNKNITIGSNGDIKTKGDVTVTGADGETTVIDGAQATFGKDAMNQTIINKGDISATAKNAADAQQSTLTHNNKGFKVEGKDASGTKASSFGFDTSTGICTFTGQDGTTTAINGSSITSNKATGDTGVLDGSNLTLTNGANSTALTAGGATFTGTDGRSDATGVKNKTIIDGGIITTDTLNVQRIELGDKLVDGNGTPLGGNLSMDEYGNIKAAGGKFTVAGTNQTNPGALHNEVGGKTFLDTTETGASMKFDNTAATDGVKSEVSVEANKATVAAGDKASFVANTDNGGTATITGGTQTVTTTGAGTVFNNSAHNTPFGGGIVTETTINGNEITTGKITTDQLVIKGNGSGNADGTGSTPGSIALGGNGSITSNIIAGTQEATFKTDETGTFTEAKDGGNKTTNTVNAQGNTNEVTDGTNTSTATQTATSIGGVVTNGTVTMKQELTADGLKLEQTGYDEVNIAKGDVTVKNNRNTATPNQEVHLSDLGSLNNLDGELAARDKYQDNKTAVGAINAEAAIRREEVARLDNRIDDVNNRVDKVGAMAAAIASLKSIGYDPQAPSEFSIGLGQYKGETGVAMGFFHYPNKNFMINVSLSTAGGETMGGIGATWRFGHKSPQKLLEEQREAQARKELAAAEKYQAAAKLAKEAQERAEYAAKLARQAQVSADNAKAAADATQAKHFQ